MVNEREIEWKMLLILYNYHQAIPYSTMYHNEFVFIENLLELQCEIYVKMHELKKLKRKANVVQKETAIDTLMTRRDLGELSRLEFVLRVSFKFLPVPAQKKKK